MFITALWLENYGPKVCISDLYSCWPHTSDLVSLFMKTDCPGWNMYCIYICIACESNAPVVEFQRKTLPCFHYTECPYLT